MSYAHKAVWQYVLRKTLYKIPVAQRHRFSCCAITIIFVSEADLLFICRRNAMVADGHFVGIPAQVFYHLFWPAKGALCIHYPWFLKQAFYKYFVCKAALPQALHIPCSKDFAQGFYRKQKLFAMF